MRCCAMAENNANRLNRLRRKESMMLGRQINERTPEWGQMYRHPAHAYPLFAAPRPLVAMEDRERWHCDICGYMWSPDGEQRKRYMSVNPRVAFNVCADCMLSPWSAWVSQKNRLLGGDSITFSDIKYVGEIDATSWPDPRDREAVLQRLDHHRRCGDLPWNSGQSRWLRLQIAAVELISDLSIGPEEVPEPGHQFRIFTSLKLDEIERITYIDDAPHHFLFIYVVKQETTMCHVLLVETSEMAVSLCEAIDKTLYHVYTQAILHSLDDHILAGLEGRTTQMEQQAEERQLLEAQQQSLDATAGAAGNDNPQSDDEDANAMHRRKSVFELFPRSESPTSPGADQPPKPRTSPPASPVTSPVSPIESKNVVPDYMRMLQAQLSNEELQHFAILLRNFRTGSTSLEALASGLNKLYGPLRRNLLPGMINFIPSSNRVQFQQFVNALT